LTPVTYSILLKGYGRQGDMGSVEMLLEKAFQNGIIPDTVMLNSLLDAMVNCKEVAKAQAIFLQITSRHNETSPNIRTYNTMLKGFAQTGALDEAIRLTKQMKERNLWDDVTTNTLVSVAMAAQDFEFAETVLADHTASTIFTDQALQRIPLRRRDHPNVEAYTSLLDGYAKAGQLDQALGTLQHMRKIGVSPNEYTYTCMISGLAKKNRIRQALKLLDFMESCETAPTAVTYNAFISALTQSGTYVEELSSSEEEEPDPQSQELGISILRRMVRKGVRPTVTTISILLESFAKCANPRISEAKSIVERFEKNGIIPSNHAKVNTAMIRVYGAANDVKGALAVFRRIEKPDIVAVNAFLDASCRSGEQSVAFHTFDHLFGSDATATMTPDVITYTILISSQLRLNTLPASRKAQELYQEMRERGISPDIALVDK